MEFRAKIYICISHYTLPAKEIFTFLVQEKYLHIFFIFSSVSTTIVCVARTGAVSVSESMIGKVDTTIINQQISQQTFVGGATFTAMTTAEMNTTIETRDTMQLTFDVVVTDQNVVALETSIATTLNLRSGRYHKNSYSCLFVFLQCY